LRVADEPILRVAFYAASPRDISRRTVLFHIDKVARERERVRGLR
jgi:hypothetical protein